MDDYGNGTTKVGNNFFYCSIVHQEGPVSTEHLVPEP